MRASSCNAGFSDSTLGWIMSGYFAGFFLGTYAAPPLIRRIGHIRAFAFYSGLCTIVVLLHPVWLHPLAWGALRFVTGLALVGLYTVIESWLNALPERQNRSRVFAAYMAVNLGALAAGQALLGLGQDLLGGPVYRTRLQGLDASRLLLGLGAVVQTRNDWLFKGEWRGLLGDGQDEHSIQLHVEKEF